MSSWEFAESMAFERLEPDPAETTAHLLALLVTITANAYRDPKRHPRPYSVEDFVPDPYGPTRAEREAQGLAVMAAFATEHARRHGRAN